MKNIKLTNGQISQNAITSIIANSVCKVAGVANRHGAFIDEFIYTVSGYDLTKGIKLNITQSNIQEINLYIDVLSNYNIEDIIKGVINQVNDDLKIFINIEPKIINVHVLEVK